MAMTPRRAIETATAAILRSDDVTDDDGHLERVQKTAAMRRLPQLSPKYEVSQILREVVPIESAGSLEQTRTVSRRSEHPSRHFTIEQRLDAGRSNSSNRDGDSGYLEK